MQAKQLFELAEGVVQGRRGEGTPVRRHSREAGYCEGVFWRPFDRQEVGRLMLAAERYERVGRKPGSRSGPLGLIAIEVLRELTRLIDFKTGRLEPAIATLMQRLRRSRDAVVRALANLRDHGFLDWLRRYVPTGNEGRGPQVQQTSNAYRLSLPPRAARLLAHLAHQPPAPDDHSHRVEAEAAEAKAQIDGLPLWEQPVALMGDTPLAQALARLGRRVASVA